MGDQGPDCERSRGSNRLLSQAPPSARGFANKQPINGRPEFDFSVHTSSPASGLPFSGC